MGGLYRRKSWRSWRGRRRRTPWRRPGRCRGGGTSVSAGQSIATARSLYARIENVDALRGGRERDGQVVRPGGTRRGCSRLVARRLFVVVSGSCQSRDRQRVVEEVAAG